MNFSTSHSNSSDTPSLSPELQLIYETAPIGLAFLSTDCRYLLINQHLTEICGISIADHIGRSVRETVPQVAEQVEQIVRNDPAFRRTDHRRRGQRPAARRLEHGAGLDHLLAPIEKPERRCYRHQCRCRGNYRAQACRSRPSRQPGAVARYSTKHWPNVLRRRSRSATASGSSPRTFSL